MMCIAETILVKKLLSEKISDHFEISVVYALVYQVMEYSSSAQQQFGRCGGLMVSVLDPGASGPGLRPGWGRCVVFLGKTLYSHSASLHPGV